MTKNYRIYLDVFRVLPEKRIVTQCGFRNNPNPYSPEAVRLRRSKQETVEAILTRQQERQRDLEATNRPAPPRKCLKWFVFNICSTLLYLASLRLLLPGHWFLGWLWMMGGGLFILYTWLFYFCYRDAGKIHDSELNELKKQISHTTLFLEAMRFENSREHTLAGAKKKNPHLEKLSMPLFSNGFFHRPLPGFMRRHPNERTNSTPKIPCPPELWKPEYKTIEQNYY